MRAIALLSAVAVLASALSAPLAPALWAAETAGRNGVQQRPPAVAQRCTPWDEAASRAISQRAQATPDVNVRLVADSIAAMRRARRLCALGSLTDACLEYDAVIRGVERRLQAGALPPMCRSITSDIPAY
jgi:hypothetical protein